MLLFSIFFSLCFALSIVSAVGNDSASSVPNISFVNIPTSSSHSLPCLVLHAANEPQLLQEYAWYTDSTRLLGVDDILRRTASFSRINSNTAMLAPPLNAAHWIAYTVQNKTGQAYFAAFEDTALDTLEIFVFRSNGTAVGHYLGGMTFASHPFYGLPDRVVPVLKEAITTQAASALSSEEGEKYLVLMRFVSREPINIIVSIGTAPAMLTALQQRDTLNVLLIGVTVAMVLYNLFLALLLRSRLYLVYTFYASTALLFSIQTSGLSVLFVGKFWTNFALQGQGIPLALFALMYSVWFCIEFLQLRAKHRALWRIGLVCIGTIAASLILWFCGAQMLVFELLLNVIMLFVIFFSTVSAIVRGRAGYQEAWIYLIAWGIPLLIFLLYGFASTGVVSMGKSYYILPQLGFSIEFLLMSFALAYRIRSLQEERQRVSLENENIIREQNIVLEQKVLERTQDLEQKNEHLAAANEEIQRQMALLDEQAKNIELANAELRQSSDNLALVNHEIMHTQAQLEEANYVLEKKNQQLIDIEQFRLNMLSIVSHDLKGPISGILGLTSILLDNPHLNRETVSILSHIQDAGNRMNILVFDLLDTAAREMGQMQLFLQPTELSDLLATALATHFQAATQKKQQFLSLFTGEYWVMGDVKRFMQVLDNLISNAVKYSPIGGRIWLQLEQTSDYVRLSVKDEGQGLSAADQKLLFGFFQRLSTQPTAGESSTGAGLAIVKQIVELHKGRVRCESEQGKGATFIVELPRYNAESSSQTQHSSMEILQ